MFAEIDSKTISPFLPCHKNDHTIINIVSSSDCAVLSLYANKTHLYTCVTDRKIAIMFLQKLSNLKILAFCFLLFPAPVFARGHFDIIGISYILGAIAFAVLLYYFWALIIGIFLLPFSIAIDSDKKLDEGLATFAVVGFFWTCMFPIEIIDRNFIKLEWYGIVVVLVVWFFIWYCFAKYIQYRGDRESNLQLEEKEKSGQ